MRKMYLKARIAALRFRNRMNGVLEGNEGMGTVEVILIILVLIGLVIIFKNQLTQLVDSIFGKIVKQAGTI